MNIDAAVLLANLGRVLAAAALALPIAWQREQTTRTMGLRTFPLVAVASCGFVLVGLEVVGDAEEAQARIIQGLMTGIGFIGGGAILKEAGGVHGTATAAGIWSTGVIGAAAGYAEYGTAITVAVVTFFILATLTPLERRMGKDDRPGDDGED